MLFKPLINSDFEKGYSCCKDCSLFTAECQLYLRNHGSICWMLYKFVPKTMQVLLYSFFISIILERSLIFHCVHIRTIFTPNFGTFFFFLKNNFRFSFLASMFFFKVSLGSNELRLFLHQIWHISIWLVCPFSKKLILFKHKIFSFLSLE